MPLTPPDLKQCQAEKPITRSFMTFGNGPKMIRCINDPLFIATEKGPGKDGLVGSMSLCASCLVVFLKQMPDGLAEITQIDGESTDGAN